MLAIKGVDSKVTATLYLEHDDDDIQLMAVDVDGENWFLAKINDEGIHLHTDIAASLGIKLDSRGRMVVVKE